MPAASAYVFRLLGPGDDAVLTHVAPGVFDEPPDPHWTAVFLADPRHHLVVALDGAQVVGMASGVDYVHPDKAPMLWINEVGVGDAYQGRGLGRLLVRALLAHGRTLGCTEAWVATMADNAAARHTYAAAGGLEDPMPVALFTFDLAPEEAPSEG